MKIIGIDPGISNVGWAMIEKSNMGIIGLSSGTIKTTSDQSLQSRIMIIVNGLSCIIREYNPSVFSLEEVFVNKNPQNSIKLIQARGAIITICSLNKLVLREFSPLNIKKTTTGVGNCDKNQIEYMVKLLIKGANPKNQHESDAFAIAYTASLAPLTSLAY